MAGSERKQLDINFGTVLGGLILFIFAGVLIFGLGNSNNDVTKNTEVEETEKVPDDQISGIVTEIFEDCSRHRVFEDGQIVEKSAISCDGGSYIKIDDVRINTVSGFTAPEFSFSYDIGDIMPGEQISAVFQLDSFGQKNFDCDTCGIK